MAFIGDNAIAVEPVETDNIGSLATLVMAELPGVSDIMVRQQLGFALREFCRETDACVIERVYRYCDGKEFPDGRVFPLAGAPSGMEVVSVFDLQSRGRSMPFDVRDFPVPSVVAHGWLCEDDHVCVKFSVAPKAGGEDCPKWFKDRYAEAIVAGAMFHMLSMTGKAWSDPQRAAQYGGKYHEAIGEAAYRRIGGSAINGGPASAVPAGGLFM